MFDNGIDLLDNACKQTGILLMIVINDNDEKQIN